MSGLAHRTLTPNFSHMRAVANKGATPRATEICYGKIAGAPIQRNSKTNIMKVPVYIRGQTTSQLCAYNGEYTPQTGDIVMLLMTSSNSRMKGQYFVVGSIAPFIRSNTVARTGTGGISISNQSNVVVLSYQPAAVGTFRAGISAYIASAGTLTIALKSYDASGTVTNTDAMFGTIGGSLITLNSYSVTSYPYILMGVPLQTKWNGTTSQPIQILCNYTGAIYVEATLEQVDS